MYFNDLTVWTVIAWSIACAWVIVVLVFILAARKQSLLQPTSNALQNMDAPRLSVIVAARNEKNCIETCIRSLFHQDYPALEVIAINDRSTDQTAQILDRLAREFAGRLRVLHVGVLPSGWFGKPHALSLGLQSASGSVVCFTDADCEFQSPSALRTAVAEMLRRKLDVFSISARYTMTSLRECVAVPCFSEVLLTWLRPERVDDPEWPDAFANGAFIMARRAEFEAIGGWGAVRTKISEDLQLARHAKQSGLRVGLSHGEGFYQTDSYGSLRDSWNGWSRIFKGALTPAQLLITVGRMTILFGLPLSATLWGATIALLTGSVDWFTHGAGLAFAIAFGLRFVLDLSMFRLMGAPLFLTPLAPFGRIYVMAAAMRALFSHLGWVHTHWRGTTFSAGQLVMLRSAKPESPIR